MARQKKEKVVVLDAPPAEASLLDAAVERIDRHPPKREFTITGAKVKDYPAGPVKQVHVDPEVIQGNRYLSNPAYHRPPIVVRVEGKPDVRAWEVEFLDVTVLVYSTTQPLVKEQSVGCGAVTGTVAWIKTTGEVRAVVGR